MPWPPASGSIGFILALVVLIVSLVFALIGRLPWEVAALVMGLAIARVT